MKYTDGFNKIASPFNWVENIFNEVFKGEDTTKETFYKGSCEGLIQEQETNYKNYYGVDYSLTENQKKFLKIRWNKLKKESLK